MELAGRRSPGTYGQGMDRAIGYINSAHRRDPEAVYDEISSAMSATIVTLREAGWIPRTPTEWISPTSGIADIGDSDMFRGIVFDQVQEALRHKMWQDLTTHEANEGLDSPPDLTGARSAFQGFINWGGYRGSRST